MSAVADVIEWEAGASVASISIGSGTVKFKPGNVKLSVWNLPVDPVANSMQQDHTDFTGYYDLFATHIDEKERLFPVDDQIKVQCNTIRCFIATVSQ